MIFASIAYDRTKEVLTARKKDLERKTDSYIDTVLSMEIDKAVMDGLFGVFLYLPNPDEINYTYLLEELNFAGYKASITQDSNYLSVSWR